MRAEKEKLLAKGKRLEESKERVRKKRVAEWVARIVQECTRVAQKAVRDGRDAAELIVVDEEGDIEEGTFWLSDGRPVIEMELAARKAVDKLNRMGIHAAYLRRRTHGYYDEGDLTPSIWYFRPIITLSGW